MTPAGAPIVASVPKATSQDDEDAWETLDAPAPSTSNQTDEATIPSNVTQVSTALVSSRNTSTNNSVLALRRRVETRRTLQHHLLENPLCIFWSHFLWHLAQEFWNLDVKIRVALMSLGMGMGCKVFMLMTWYLYYPKMIMMSLILLMSWGYLYPEDLERKIESFFTALVMLPHRIPQALEYMDMNRARMVCLLGFFVPTLLQARTITALAGINAGGSLLWSSFVTIFMACSSAFFISPPRSKAARDVSQICLVVLYGSALWITLCHFRILAMPRLAAPFFVSTGTLLLAYEGNDSMEWCSGLVRSALRLTLRDVLASVGTSVQEDEMLQLALLRWIVDYWSYTPPQSSQSSNAPTPTASTPAQADTTAAHTPNQDLQWDELFPMLDTTTDLMTSEVHSLQQQQQQQPPQKPPATCGESKTASPEVSESPAGTSTTTASPADNSLQNLHNMLTSMNVDERARPAVEAYKHKVENFPPSREVALLISVLRRCPACLALLWQLLVASMFQSSGTTVAMVTMLTPMIILDLIRIRAWLNACESLSRMFDGRSSEGTAGSATSQFTSAESPGFLNHFLPDADPMTITLSGDDVVMQSSEVTDSHESTTTVTTQVKIPTLLIVWRNMKSAVGALESSLTAARCVQTGAIAVDFAQNVISLAQFGNEVHKHGWMHGLTLIAKEVVFHHQGDISSAPRGSEATFTYAAVNAVRNGQRVAHHLGVLAEDEGPVGQFVAPIVGFFGFLGGLFDQKKQGDNQESPASEGNLDPITSIKSEEQKDDAFLQDDEWESTSTKKQERASNTSAIVQEDIPPPQRPGEVARADEARVKELDFPASVSEVAGEIRTPSQSDGGSKDLEFQFNKVDDSPGVERLNQLGKQTEQSQEDSSKVHVAKSIAAVVRPERSEVVVEEVSVDSSEAEADATPAPIQPETAELESTEVPSEGEESTEELGVVMDLIADAYERSLIDEPEKNEFCLKLSAGARDKALVAGMKATLQGLINEASQGQAEPGVGVAPPDTEAKGKTDRKCSSPDQSPGTGGGAVTESIMSDGGWSPIVSSPESEEATIQPLDYSERLASAVRTREALAAPQLVEGDEEDDGIPTVESSAPARNDDEDNMWVKVGSGIAVIGAAVVGAAILAGGANADNLDRDRDQNENQTGRSGVTIERLDDEEETGNEWESTTAAQRGPPRKEG